MNVSLVVSVSNHRVWGARSCFQVAASLAWWHRLWLLRCQCGFKRELYAITENFADMFNELLTCNDSDCCILERAQCDDSDCCILERAQCVVWTLKQNILTVNAYLVDKAISDTAKLLVVAKLHLVT